MHSCSPCVEILFLVVIENVIAQRLSTRYSSFAADHADHISRYGFTCGSFLVFLILFVTGDSHKAFNLSPVAVLACVQVIIGICILLFIGRMVYYLKCLPGILLTHLVKEMNTGTLLWGGVTMLDAREIRRVYRYMDEDGDGDLAPDEILNCLIKHGLKIKSDKDKLELRQHIARECGNCVHLEDFQKHFGAIFGRGITALRRHFSETSKAAPKVFSEIAPDIPPDASTLTSREAWTHVDVDRTE